LFRRESRSGPLEKPKSFSKSVGRLIAKGGRRRPMSIDILLGAGLISLGLACLAMFIQEGEAA
jgi:hypothetical protein